MSQSMEHEHFSVFLRRALIRALRRAAIGWLLNSGLSGATTLLRYIGRRKGALNDVLKAIVLNKGSVYLGLFMALFGLIFQLSRRALRLSGLSSATQHAIAGSAAGLSIVALQPCKGTHLDPGALSLHSLVRAAQAAMRQQGLKSLHVTSGSAPFIACCTLIMYCWFFHPDALGRDCECVGGGGGGGGRLRAFQSLVLCASSEPTQMRSGSA
jgi:hypothetical protein